MTPLLSCVIFTKISVFRVFYISVQHLFFGTAGTYPITDGLFV